MVRESVTASCSIRFPPLRSGPSRPPSPLSTCPHPGFAPPGAHLPPSGRGVCPHPAIATLGAADRLAEAAALLEAAVTLWPAEVPLVTGLAEARVRQGRTDDARRLLEGVLSPAESLFTLGQFLTLAGRAEEAKPLFEEAHRLDPRWPKDGR